MPVQGIFAAQSPYRIYRENFFDQLTIMNMKKNYVRKLFIGGPMHSTKHSDHGMSKHSLTMFYIIIFPVIYTRFMC